MFQPTTFFALFALATSTTSAPYDLEKRFQCSPSVTAADCTVKSDWFNACVEKGEIPANICITMVADITAANPTPIKKAPMAAAPLQKRYECLPSVPIDDCTARATFFARCEAAKLIPVADCYAQSLNITAKVNNPLNPAHPWPTPY